MSENEQISAAVALEACGWPDASRPGFPLHPEQDSEGHVLRMDGEAMCDIYRWSASHQWFEDPGGRWCAPCDLVKDGDHYLGQIAAPRTPATTGEGEVGRLKADLKDEINFDINTRTNKVPESVVDQVVDLLAARNLLALAALPPSSGWEAAAEAMREAAAAVLNTKAREYHSEFGSRDPETGVTEYPGNGDEWMQDWEETAEAIRALPLPPPPSREGA